MGDLGQLIEDYERAYARLETVIADANLQSEALYAADAELDRSFRALLDAKFVGSKNNSAHIEYLIKIVKSLHPEDSVLAVLVDRIGTAGMGR